MYFNCFVYANIRTEENLEEDNLVGWMLHFFEEISNSLVRLNNKLRDLNKQFKIIEEADNTLIPESFRMFEHVSLGAETTGFNKVLNYYRWLMFIIIVDCL